MQQVAEQSLLSSAARLFEVGQAYHYKNFEGCNDRGTCAEQSIKFYLQARSAIHKLKSEIEGGHSVYLSFDLPGMLNDMGLIFASRGQTDEAIQMYREALELKPELISALSNLATIYITTGHWAAAEKEYITAIKVLEQTPHTDSTPYVSSVLAYNYGVLLQRDQRLAEAAVQWAKAVELNPQGTNSLAKGNLAYISCLRDHGNDAELGPELIKKGEKRLGEILWWDNKSPSSQPSYVAYSAAILSAKGPSVDYSSYFTLRMQQIGAIVPPLPPMTARSLKIRDAYLILLQEVRDEVEVLFSQGLLKRGAVLQSPLDAMGCGSFGYFFIYQGFDDLLLRRMHADVLFALSGEALQFTAPFLLGKKLTDPVLHPRPSYLPSLTPFGTPAAFFRRMRVGFLSAYWYHHSVGLLLQQVVAGLDRTVFDVHLILLGLPRERFDNVTWGLIASVDGEGAQTHSNVLHLTLANLRGAQAAIAALQLDVLVFGEIGMNGLTYALAFSRLARRSLVFWGHAISSGVAPTTFTQTEQEQPSRLLQGGPDYFVSSMLFESCPWRSQQRYTERLILMPSLTTAFVRPAELSELRPELDNVAAVFGLATPVGTGDKSNALLERSSMQMRFLDSFFTPQDGTEPAPWHSVSYSGLRIYTIPQTLYKLHPDGDGLWLAVLHADPKAIMVFIHGGSGPAALGSCKAGTDGNAFGKGNRNENEKYKEAGYQKKLPTWASVILSRLCNTADKAASLAANLTADPVDPYSSSSSLTASLIRRVVFLPSLSPVSFMHLLTLSDVVLDPFPVGGGRSSFEVFSVPVPIVMLYPRTSILQLTYGMYRAMGFKGALSEPAFPVPSPTSGSAVRRCCICHSSRCYVQQAVAIASDPSFSGSIRRRIAAHSIVLFDLTVSGVLDDWREMLLRIASTPRPQRRVKKLNDYTTGLKDDYWKADASTTVEEEWSQLVESAQPQPSTSRDVRGLLSQDQGQEQGQDQDQDHERKKHENQSLDSEGRLVSLILTLPVPRGLKLGFLAAERAALDALPSHDDVGAILLSGAAMPLLGPGNEAALRCLRRFTSQVTRPQSQSQAQAHASLIVEMEPLEPLDMLQVVFACSVAAVARSQTQHGWELLARLKPQTPGQLSTVSKGDGEENERSKARENVWRVEIPDDNEWKTGGDDIRFTSNASEGFEIRAGSDLSLALRAASMAGECRAETEAEGEADPEDENVVAVPAFAREVPEAPSASRRARPQSVSFTQASVCIMLGLASRNRTLQDQKQDQVLPLESTSVPPPAIARAVYTMEAEGGPLAVGRREAARRAWLLLVQSTSTGLPGISAMSGSKSAAAAAAYGSELVGLAGVDSVIAHDVDRESSSSGDTSENENNIEYEDGITVVITTSKRLGLFKRSAASLISALPCLAGGGKRGFSDLESVTADEDLDSGNRIQGSPDGIDVTSLCRQVRRVLVIDDCSSDADRLAMLAAFPHWAFVWHNDTSLNYVNGHARSMNTALAAITTTKMLYLEDDWLALSGSEAGAGGQWPTEWSLPFALTAATRILSPSAATDDDVTSATGTALGTGMRRCRERVALVLLNDQSTRPCAEGAMGCDVDAVGRALTQPQPGAWPRQSSWSLCGAGMTNDPQEVETEAETESRISRPSHPYLLHEFGVLDGATRFSYWPGLSLNPGLWDVELLRTELGRVLPAHRAKQPFDETDPHFERRFSVTGLMAGLRMAFLPAVVFGHIGKKSAYVINNNRRDFDS